MAFASSNSDNAAKELEPGIVKKSKACTRCATKITEEALLKVLPESDVDNIFEKSSWLCILCNKNLLQKILTNSFLPPPISPYFQANGTVMPSISDLIRSSREPMKYECLGLTGIRNRCSEYVSVLSENCLKEGINLRCELFNANNKANLNATNLVESIEKQQRTLESITAQCNSIYNEMEAAEKEIAFITHCSVSDCSGSDSSDSS